MTAVLSTNRVSPAQTAAPKPISSNAYSIELFQGPLLAPNRVSGLSGAYTALAEGVEGASVNSAGPAVRDAHSHAWLDYDVSVGISIPGALGNIDFDNRGTTSGTDRAKNTSNFLDVNLGAVVQFGRLGVSVTADGQQYTLNSNSQLDLGRLKALVAYGFSDGQFVVGFGVRAAVVQVAQGGTTLLSMVTAWPEVGALVMPTGLPFRIGATLRGGDTGKAIPGGANIATTNGVTSVASLITPQTVSMPWEAEVGLAYQLGPRPLNPGWEDPSRGTAVLRAHLAAARGRRERDMQDELALLSPDKRAARANELEEQERAIERIEERRLQEESQQTDAIRVARYKNWPREKILMLASVLVTGQSPNAVSLAGFFNQVQDPVGQSVSFTPRLGIEGEPVHDRLVVRAGTYLEPSRYSEGTARQHFTFGGDVKLWPFDAWGLIPTTVWKASVFGDIAPRYVNGGLAFGVWH